MHPAAHEAWRGPDGTLLFLLQFGVVSRWGFAGTDYWQWVLDADGLLEVVTDEQRQRAPLAWAVRRIAESTTGDQS